MRRCATLAAPLGPLNDFTIAVCRRESELYVSGRRVYIRDEGIKPVTDACKACCDDPLNGNLTHPHLDNFTTDTRCSGIGSLPNALGVIIY